MADRSNSRWVVADGSAEGATRPVFSAVVDQPAAIVSSLAGFNDQTTMSVERYNARTAEIRWQQAWDTQNVFHTRNDDPQPPHGAPRMAPSGRIDMDHVRNCIMGDVVARYGRARRVAVRRPAEWDASCMLAENPAAGAVLRSLGLAAAWSRRIPAGDPNVKTGPADDTCTASAIDPASIIDTYGADATRWFVLSDSPPDRDVVWSEASVIGAWRFVHRLWRLINNAAKFSAGAPAIPPAAFASPAVEVRKTAHRALLRVSGNIERLRFNVCVAHIRAFARTVEAAVTDSPEPVGADLKFAAREAAEIMVQLFHPMMPHLAEECWAALGHDSLVAARNWPAVETDLLTEGTVTLPVHVNGRKRGDVAVARDARNGDIEASVLALDVIRRALDGKTPRKVIIVPQRIINVVA